MKKPRQAWGLLAWAAAVQSSSLPYNPTRIFRPENSSYVYIFTSTTKSNNNAQLLSLDFSNSISASKPQYSTISSTLPFLRDGELIPYTPTTDAGGNITILAGQCSQGFSEARIWQFQAEPNGKSGKGSWSEHGASYLDSGQSGRVTGPDFLAASISFSSSVDGDASDTRTYVIGGMCPLENSTANTWVSAATYSDSMLSIALAANDQYQITGIVDRGSPIAQAGSALIPLTPTYSADDSQIAQTQQQDFVLLGGHTQVAFVNMSQVGLFSLPQRTWAFVPVEQPSNSQVTPRSGHTAVLSESGDSIIVFGGWVGDVDTPAQPQLAILELGSGYGGTGNWRWTVPQQYHSGLDPDYGLYGHGATLLPGGVMMIVGGYEISSSSSKRTKRSRPASSDRVLLYNTTSNSWLDSYEVPNMFTRNFEDSAGPLSKTSQQAGLGAGLAIGAILVLSAVAFYIWYGKRLKRAREDRERALLYSSDGSSFGAIEQPFLQNGGIDGRGGNATALGALWSPSGGVGGAQSRPPPMQQTTGMWINAPSPTRGLRKGVAGKGYQYHAAPRCGDERMNHGGSSIHPIAEQENEDGQESITSLERDELSDAERKLRDLERVLHGGDDPFLDPEPTSPGAEAVKDSLWHDSGDISKPLPISRRPVPTPIATRDWSPVKPEDRTFSNLSKRTMASDTSITRTMSTRTGAVLSAAAATFRQAASQNALQIQGADMTTSERSNTMSSYFSAPAHSPTTGPLTPGETSTQGADIDAPLLPRSEFQKLQSEGEALLGGRPKLDRDDPYQRAVAAQTASRSEAVRPLFSPPPIPTRRRPGLFGSLRRALNVVSLSERSVSLTIPGEPSRDGMRSTSSSPTKERSRRIGTSPRRAVSDGGALLRQKRGEKDWTEKQQLWRPYRDDPNDDDNDWGQPIDTVDPQQAEEDWDVETAAEKRNVQVMFTVPKSRLRVVNDDMDRASLRSVSDGAVSRKESLRVLKREEREGARTLLWREEKGVLGETCGEGEEGEKVKFA